jgi:polyhydroxyalkanoate synthesis regulator phasin
MPPAKRPSSAGSKSASTKPAAKRAATGSRATRAAASRGAKATATSADKAASRTATQAKSAATKTRNAATAGATRTKRASAAGGARATAKAAGAAAASTAKTARSGAKGTATAAKSGAKSTRSTARSAATSTRRAGGGDSIASVAEQLAKGAIKPADLVMLTRDRIQETLDDAASRGRVTRKDANDLVSELVRRGRSQSDDLLTEIQGLLGTATKRARSTEPVDRIVRGADRARRAAGVGKSFPILGYDDLNVGQVTVRVKELSKPELRKVLTYERKNANRKSVVGAIEKALG